MVSSKEEKGPSGIIPKTDSDKRSKKLDADGGISYSAKQVPSNSTGEEELSSRSNGQISFEEMFSQVEEYAIIILDENGVIISWNKGAERIKGYTAGEIIGKNYRIFYSPEDRDRDLPGHLLEVAQVKGNTSYEGWRVRKDGTRFWGSMTLTAFRDGQGRVVRFLKVTRDLTERKLAEDKFSNLLEELKTRNEELRKSEERYHKMISEVRDYAIILLDTDGTILDWNLGAEHVKGYTPSEIIGKNFRLFYPTEEKEADLPGRLLSMAARNGSVTHEGWRLRKDGGRFWGSVAITALHNEEGEIIGFSKVTRDLTARKIAEDKMANMVEELQQANEQLRQSEERYHRMIEEVQDYAIVLLDPAGNIQNWNAGAQVIKGYAAPEIVGKNFRAFYTDEDLKDGLPERLLESARTNGKVVHEGWRLRKNGSRFWGSVVITALHNPAGDVIGYSKLTRDLTQRREAEEAMRASAAQLDLKNRTLERLNAELSSFSYIASHDLKEPLRKIQNFAGRLEEDTTLSESNKGYLHKIMESASRMQKLIHDLLSYSEVSNDSLDFQPVDMNDVLQDVLEDLEIVIGEKKAVIRSGRLPVVDGVYHQLSQMTFNLLSNALKFSRKEEPPLIEIEADITDCPSLPGNLRPVSSRCYHLTFRDNGIGFDAEFSTKIFQAFQRLHSRFEFSGTGIGLAIVKKVVDNHHGFVQAESALGQGATFHVYLPVQSEGGS